MGHTSSFRSRQDGANDGRILVSPPIAECETFYGDDPREGKEGMRLGFLNVNTLTFDTRDQETSEGIKTLLALDFYFLCFQEVNENLKEFELSRRWHRFFRRNIRRGTYHYATSPWPGDSQSSGGYCRLLNGRKERVSELSVTNFIDGKFWSLQRKRGPFKFGMCTHLF